uniref:Uncharacterized protein n=1 Tax=Plectus sambesii TaxID=2011161 RepID=A0A914WHB9_9BILA
MESLTSRKNETNDSAEDREETAGLHAKKRRRPRSVDASDVEGNNDTDQPFDEGDNAANAHTASTDLQNEAPTVVVDSDESVDHLEASEAVEDDKDELLKRMKCATDKLLERLHDGGGTSDSGRENAVVNADLSPNIFERQGEHSDVDDGDERAEVDEDDHDDEDEDDDEEEDGEDIRMEEASSASEMGEGGEGSLEGIPDFSTLPPHHYQLNQAVRARELGRATRLGADSFVYRFMGSLHVVERLELMTKLEGHTGCVNCLSFNSDGTKLASGSDDTNVVVWDWAAERPLISFDSGHTMNVFQAKFMPLSGDCHMVTCARDGQVRLAELSVRGVCKSTRRLARHTSSAHKLALDANSPHVFLSCGEDAVVFDIDLRTAEANKILTVRKDDRKVALYSVHCNPADGNYFCVAGRDSQVRVYDRRRIAADGAAVKSYCPHHLVNAASGYGTNVTAAVYNHNGTELLATYNDDDIYTFDTSHSDGADYTHRYMGHRNNQTVKGVNYFGPKSEFIVSGSDCGNVFLWEHDSQKIVQVQFADEGGVPQLYQVCKQ